MDNSIASRAGVLGRDDPGEKGHRRQSSLQEVGKRASVEVRSLNNF